MKVAAEASSTAPLYLPLNTEKPQLWDLKSAYAYCAKITYGHYENFPVASLFIPPKLRPAVTAVYAFARLADDFADEANFAGQRLVLLKQWEEALQRCTTSPVAHPIFMALGHTLNQHQLPKQLFRDLLLAFTLDVTKETYANFDEVLHYCRHSANPVGRIILHLFGYDLDRDAPLFQWSDQICTGLQLANFWQDIAVDLQKNRVYLPQDEIRHFGYSLEELQQKQFNKPFQALMRFQVERTEKLLRDGSNLCQHLRGRLRWEIKLTCLGGLIILKKIRRLNFNTLDQRPKLNGIDKACLLLRTFIGNVG